MRSPVVDAGGVGATGGRGGEGVGCGTTGNQRVPTYADSCAACCRVLLQSFVCMPCFGERLWPSCHRACVCFSWTTVSTAVIVMISRREVANTYIVVISILWASCSYAPPTLLRCCHGVTGARRKHTDPAPAPYDSFLRAPSPEIPSPHWADPLLVMHSGSPAIERFLLSEMRRPCS